MHTVLQRPSASAVDGMKSREMVVEETRLVGELCQVMLILKCTYPPRLYAPQGAQLRAGTAASVLSSETLEVIANTFSHLLHLV